VIEEEQEILDEKTKKDLMEMVHYKYWEYSVIEIIEHMNEKGYESVGKIVEEALLQNIFSVNTIDDDGSVQLELGWEGEDLWNGYNKGKEGYFDNDEDEIKKIQWKCSMCSYQFEGNVTPPENCPSCGQTCSFIDATCYIPECKGPEGRDRRI
jgi:rubredoxin